MARRDSAASKPGRKAVDEDARRKLRLVEDTRPGVFSRRRADCGRLNSCEGAWIRVYGGADTQARCPEACEGFVRKAER